MNFTGDPPEYWWSDMCVDDLLKELQRLFAGFEIVSAWTDEPEGPAYMALADERVFIVTGDGQSLSCVEIV